MALIGRTENNPNSSTRTLEANQIFRDQGGISGIESNAQILQRFLGFYVLELCDLAVRWIAKDKMYNF